MRLPKLTLAAALLCSVAAAASVSIEYKDGAFRVLGASFQANQTSQESSGFLVHTEGSDIALFGSYTVDHGQLVFHPRYPLAPGVTYIANLGSEVIGRVSIPKPATQPARVLAIYPSTPVLPDNQLKLYLLFSAPMQGGEEIFSKIHLVDSNGTPAYLPFVSQELWNRDYTRLTLIFDPGRIKRGVKPNVDMGPVLVEGKHYTLIVDREMKDGNGNPLAEEFRHDFAAGPSERRGIDPKAWKFAPPSPGTRDPLTIYFDRPLDYALLGDCLQIPRVSGKATIGPGETRWNFQPDQPWIPGEHKIVVSMALEDQAGNRIGRPFDVDEFLSPAPRINADATSLTFQIAQPDR